VVYFVGIKMSQKKKVGILGGSFDPVHFGHINLALCLKESCMLDEVLFIPAGVSPFKESAPPVVSSEHRLKMLKLALAPIKEFRVIDWELNRQGPSYTIDTVRTLAEDSSLELHLLIGDDHRDSFHLWKDADELVRLAPLLIGTRGSSSEGKHQQLLGKKVLIPILDISSTLIRSRLSQKKYCGHLMPASVLDYIGHHHLY
jgi:nicotinate-nucleotide adenylyltransferase